MIELSVYLIIPIIGGIVILVDKAIQDRRIRKKRELYDKWDWL